MNFTLRLIADQDIEGFHALLDSVAREKRYLAMVVAPSLERVSEFVLGNIKRNYAQYVAEADGAIVGWADIIPGQRDSSRHMGSLGMGIAREHRGKGIGRALLGRAIQHCWEMGLVRIELEVFANNSVAIALYRDMGFEEEGLLRKARLIDGVYRDVYHMALLHPSLWGSTDARQPAR